MLLWTDLLLFCFEYLATINRKHEQWNGVFRGKVIMS